jgi:hypothetical protein
MLARQTGSLAEAEPFAVSSGDAAQETQYEAHGDVLKSAGRPETQLNASGDVGGIRCQ